MNEMRKLMETVEQLNEGGPSIRELRKQQADALDAYHEEYNRIEAEIEAIRAKRGTKLKDPYGSEDSYGMDPGRERARRNGNW